MIRAAKGGRIDSGVVADTLLAFMVRLVGMYRRFVRKGVHAPSDPCAHPDFDEAAFVADAPLATQPFLKTLRGSQLFEVWLRRHVEMGEAERALSAFERAVAATPPAHLGGANPLWAVDLPPAEEKVKMSRSEAVRAKAATPRCDSH